MKHLKIYEEFELHSRFVDIKPLSSDEIKYRQEIEDEINSILLNIKDDILEDGILINIGSFTRKTTGCHGFGIYISSANKFDISKSVESVIHLIEYMYSIGYGLNKITADSQYRILNIIWSSGRSISDNKPFPQDISEITKRLGDSSKELLKRFSMEFEN